jgi:hypothetical protein
MFMLKQGLEKELTSQLAAIDLVINIFRQPPVLFIE